MKYWTIIIILFLIFCMKISAQSYGKKEIFVNYGSWGSSYEKSNIQYISISSYVTKQKILTCKDFKRKLKIVSKLPKYRYELVLTSGSFYNNKFIKTCIYGTKIYIDNVEMTNEQFPNGFTAIIGIKPTTIY